MIDLKTLTIKKAHEHLLKGDFSARELAAAYQKEIEARNPEIHAYLEVFADIDTQAAMADKKIKEGTAGMLTGIPLAIKDNILIKGRIASAASKILEKYRATYDATVISKLKESGAVFLGRTNMDEFAMGSSTENSAFGATRNPHDPTRVPGGSSGGSAAAVAMRGALAALGSDTGGSIRQPASFCGIVGMKPSYGAVSRSGLMAMASSLDQIGPLANTVEDAEVLFGAIKGKDPLDSTSMDISDTETSKRKFKIGVPFDFLQGIDAEIMKNFNASLDLLKAKGYEIVDIKMPNLKYSLAVYYIIVPAEVSSNLARFDGIKYGLHVAGDNLLEDYLLTREAGFGPEPRRRIILGTYVLSSGYYDAYYYKARELRTLIRKEFENAFESVDFIMTPTAPNPAFKIGEKISDPLSMYLEDIFTVPVNIAGVPALSVPSGFVSRDGRQLPLGVQFIAPMAKDRDLFVIGKLFESAGV